MLIDQQHSFRSGRSCETQLVGTINDFAETSNHLGQIDVIFLDISKSFDIMPLKDYTVNSLTTVFMDVPLSG